MRQKQRVFSLFLLSPSSWRAWIEIATFSLEQARPEEVALLMEGVDRNIENRFRQLCPDRSPSSWRAWIEIPLRLTKIRHTSVALLMEGVDRNLQAYYHLLL